ncbi:hypothetical protein BT93_G2228 [Corymbia citriodora subsp. variegata]|nr:hypothetical protein BT93_G2228 [Corymbia citriodora subsp. variegata]
MEGREEDVRLGANRFSERQPIGTVAQTQDGRDYREPPPTPLFEPSELTSWSFYRAGIAEFAATFLFLYITELTVMGLATTSASPASTPPPPTTTSPAPCAAPPSPPTPAPPTPTPTPSPTSPPSASPTSTLPTPTTTSPASCATPPSPPTPAPPTPTPTPSPPSPPSASPTSTPPKPTTTSPAPCAALPSPSASSPAARLAKLALPYNDLESVVQSPTKCASVGIQGIAWAFGGIFFALVYCTTDISGGHINPAVTFGLLLARKQSLTRAVFYMAMQCLGAICGAGMVKAFGKKDGGGANMVNASYFSPYPKGDGLGTEIVSTFFLIYTVFSATDAKRSAQDSHVP